MQGNFATLFPFLANSRELGNWGAGSREQRKFLSFAPFPLPLCLFSMPNAQCPMPNAQCPMPNA
ncbi:MAG: hypothetical protein PUQ00_25055, partial [Nostoc sp. S13]|nr:hypothetical protein [Nostoc sp. S13]